MAATTDAWVPTVDDVALLLRTRTVGVDQPLSSAGWLGADTGPTELTTFDATTRPTDVEVEKVVELCVAFVTVQLPIALELVPELQYGTLKYAIALYAAINIEVSFFRETANQDLINLWTALADRALRGIGSGGEPVGARFSFGTLRIGTLADEEPELQLNPADMWTPWGWDPWGPAQYDTFGPGDLSVPGTIPRRGRG